jgi:hypothetical protein
MLPAAAWPLHCALHSCVMEPMDASCYCAMWGEGERASMVNGIYIDSTYSLTQSQSSKQQAASRKQLAGSQLALLSAVIFHKDT